MSRISLYLPDDLEARVKEASGDNLSAFFQRAARALLGNEGRATHRPAPDARHRLPEIVKKLADDAETTYAAGYEAAVKRLPELSWDVLDGWAEDDFGPIYSPGKWLESYTKLMFDQMVCGSPFEGQEFPEDFASSLLWQEGVANDLAVWVQPIERFFPRSRTFRNGYADALRDAYQAVTRGDFTESDGEGFGEVPES